MIATLLSSLLSPRCRAVHLAVLAGAASLTALSSVHAAVPTVKTGDTFNIELEGYNNANPSGNFYAINPTIDPTFGTTTTYTTDANGNPYTITGDPLTISSSETVTGNIFTVTISLSTPNTFLPAGLKDNNGNVIDSLEFSIGNYNLPANGATDALNFNSPLPTDLSITGTVTGSFGTVTIPNDKQNPQTGPNRMAFSDLYSVTTTPLGQDIGADSVRTFTLTITNAVPEPSTTGATVLGAGALVGLMVVRRRRATA